MKNKYLVPVLMLSSSAFMQHAMADSGVINFKGAIVKSSCDTMADSKNVTVVLGKWPTTSLSTAGQTTPAQTFQINLENCETGNYRIRLDGKPYDSSSNANVLALTPGGATGVGIKVQSVNNEDIGLNQSLDNAYTVAASNDNKAVFNLKAFYYAVAPATEGVANSVANFSIEYK